MRWCVEKGELELGRVYAYGLRLGRWFGIYDAILRRLIISEELWLVKLTIMDCHSICLPKALGEPSHSYRRPSQYPRIIPTSSFFLFFFNTSCPSSLLLKRQAVQQIRTCFFAALRGEREKKNMCDTPLSVTENPPNTSRHDAGTSYMGPRLLSAINRPPMQCRSCLPQHHSS